MPLLNTGRDYIAQAIFGTASLPFNNTNARIYVGDSSVAFSASQTDLQASINKLRKAMDVSFPSISGNTITFKSTFAQNEANFTWNEWGIINNSSGGVLLNRRVENLGTKTSSQTWEFTVDIIINNP